MIVRTSIARLTHDSSRAVGRIMLAMTCVLAYYASAETECLATEIAILKSSSISAYDQAITGFKSTAPSGVIYSEYDLQGDLEQGRKLARKIRASEASLVVAVGLKAALAAKLEIVDIPIVYMMILDPSKHNLTAPNMTGTLLEIPAERQFKILRAFLPDLHRMGLLSNSGQPGQTQRYDRTGRRSIVPAASVFRGQRQRRAATTAFAVGLPRTPSCWSRIPPS